MNLHHLKDLNEEEFALLKKIPALVTILIGSADNNLNEKEIHVGHLSTEFRKDHGDVLVHDYYNWVAPDYDYIFEQEWAKYKNIDFTQRIHEISEELSKVNQIFSKINKNYAHSLLESWRGLARAVARASGGLLGRLSVSHEEKNLMGLDMISL
ncbi:MAG: hypothetical protein LC105_07855 [Chitinophagales bacterium]|nr:hypothetical protein [Chitinophagales bacterium]MCZ2393752.1 hypothetical protein [Chitinophagales bacterium]